MKAVPTQIHILPVSPCPKALTPRTVSRPAATSARLIRIGAEL